MSHVKEKETKAKKKKAVPKEKNTPYGQNFPEKPANKPNSIEKSSICIFRVATIFLLEIGCTTKNPQNCPKGPSGGFTAARLG